MKEFKQEVTTYITKYEAIDGTVFSDKEECKKYDQSAKANLQARLKEFEVKRDTEYNIFGLGSDEAEVSIVKLRDLDDFDVIIQLCYLYNEPYYNNYQDELSKLRSKYLNVLKNNDYLFIFRGYYGEENFYIYDSLTNILNNIVKCCDPDSVVEIKDNLNYE